MALSDKSFVEKINSCLNRNLSGIENTQLADSISKISTNKIDSVISVSQLPAATENTGRMIFVVEADTYYYSDGQAWTKDLNSIFETLLYAWGCNGSRQLGDGTTTSRCSPISTLGKFTGWQKVSAGTYHSLAIKENGTLWGWGGNGDGVLGDGTNVEKVFPTLVCGNFTDWCDVASSCSFSAAIRKNGTLWTWGDSFCCQLGEAATRRCSPEQPRATITDWCQVSACGAKGAAVRRNGTIWTWGINSVGQGGLGSVSCSENICQVIGDFTDWCYVSTGNSHNVALRQNGTIWAWGCNGNGRLGDGTVTDRCSPVSVVGGFTDWCQVSAGGLHTAAIRQNGTLWTWGSNSNGTLGDGTTVLKTSPVSVVGGFTDWCQVSSGLHTAAVRQNGTLWTWGCNCSGRLGDGTTINRCSPVSVVGGFTDWWRTSSSTTQTLALRYTNTDNGF